MCSELGSEKPFGNLHADQVIKDTVNKDTHTSGGTRGFSLQPRAVAKYYITAERQSTSLKEMREMARQFPIKLKSSKLTNNVN